MFLSFLPPFGMRQPEAPYLWVLYKQVTHLNPDEVVFLGAQDYFDDPAHHQAAQRWDISLQAQEYAGFAIPSADQLARYRRFLIPDALVESWVRTGAPRAELMRRMLCSRLPDLESCLRTAIRELSETETIEAIFSWCNVPSLTSVAEEFGLPVIHNELGALRAPCYRGTAYFDFSGVNGGTEAAQRYEAFKAGLEAAPQPLLSKAEILDLMLVAPLPARASTNPDMPVGLALQIEDDTNIVAFSSGWDSKRLLEEASTEFGVDQLLIRHHPGGLTTYPESYGRIDRSITSVEFISRCRTVVTINSSVGLEAMLLDRDTRILGDSPCAIALDAEGRALAPTAETRTEQQKTAELRALNFLVFGYLIPYEFLYDPGYLRWRLGRPDESDILNFHLDYWKVRRSLSDQGLRQRTTPNALTQRGLINMALIEEMAQRPRTTNLAGQVRRLEERTRAFEAECAEMRNSLSWRLTSPLRTLDSWTRQRLRARRTSPIKHAHPAPVPGGLNGSAPLKIAVISKADRYGGGASRVAEELTTLLRGAGHRADHWLSWAGGEWQAHMKSLYGALQLPVRLANLILRKLGLAELLPFELAILLYRGRIWEYDLVHFHDLSSAISPSTLRWLARRLPVVWTIHDCSPFTGGCLYPMDCERFKTRCGSCPQRGTWPLDCALDFTGFQQDRKRELAASGLVHYVTPSTWMAQTAQSSGLFPTPPEILSNGVNTEIFRPADKRAVRGELGIPLDRIVVLLAAGALQDARKGTRYAIDVLLAVRDLPPGQRPFVLLVGHSSPEIRSQLAEFEIMEAGYLGDATALARHYAAADLFLFTSLADNQPLVVLETMAAGTPVLGFRTGGIPELVVQNETGFLAEPRDVETLATRLRHLLVSPGILAEWSLRCSARAKTEYSHDRFLERHLTLYQRVLAARRHGDNLHTC